MFGDDLADVASVCAGTHKVACAAPRLASQHGPWGVSLGFAVTSWGTDCSAGYGSGASAGSGCLRGFARDDSLPGACDLLQRFLVVLLLSGAWGVSGASGVSALHAVRAWHGVSVALQAQASEGQVHVQETLRSALTVCRHRTNQGLLHCEHRADDTKDAPSAMQRSAGLLSGVRARRSGS